MTYHPIPLVLAAALLLCRSVSAEPAPLGVSDLLLPEYERQSISGPIDEASKHAAMQAYVAAAESMQWDTNNLVVEGISVIGVPEGVGMQVFLGTFDLGEGGILFLQSEVRDVFQRMTQSDLILYGGRSAFFPVGKLTVVLFRKEGSEKPRMTVERVRVFNSQEAPVLLLNPPKNEEALFTPLNLNTENISDVMETVGQQSLCGGDDRGRSDDAKVGRLMPIGCTAWLIQDDVALSAGHCNSGEAMSILEFQVPSSNPFGETRPAHPNDQYPVIQSSIISENLGVGHDWAVFKLGRNSNTGELPGQRQGGHFKLTTSTDSVEVRVTGYGIDNTDPGAGGGRNEDNQTQQTEDGKPSGSHLRYFRNPSSGSYFRYTVDTTGGNSGSPVIVKSTPGEQEVCVAIHTNAGCGTGGNHGTALDNTDLRNAIEKVVGELSKVYVESN